MRIFTVYISAVKEKEQEKKLKLCSDKVDYFQSLDYDYNYDYIPCVTITIKL